MTTTSQPTPDNYLPAPDTPSRAPISNGALCVVCGVWYVNKRRVKVTADTEDTSDGIVLNQSKIILFCVITEPAQPSGNEP